MDDVTREDVKECRKLAKKHKLTKKQILEAMTPEEIQTVAAIPGKQLDKVLSWLGVRI